MDKSQLDELVSKVGEEAGKKIEGLFSEYQKKSITLGNVKNEITDVLKSFKPNMDVNELKIEGKSIAEILKAQAFARRHERGRPASGSYARHRVLYRPDYEVWRRTGERRSQAYHLVR